MRSLPLFGSLAVAFLFTPLAPAMAQPVAPCACWVPAPMGQGMMPAGPGMMPAGPGMMAPGAMPVMVEEAEPWEENRFGVSLRAGSMGLSDLSGVEDEFSVAGIGLRYRLSRRWEAALTLDAGGSESGATTVESTTAALLLHLRPAARWDWYLLAGLGESTRATFDEGDITASHVAFGAGIERRYEHLVLGVELRMLGGEHVSREVNVAPATADAAERQPILEEASHGGGQLTFSAGWMF